MGADYVSWRFLEGACLPCGMVKQLSVSRSCDRPLDQELLTDHMGSEMSRGGCGPGAAGVCASYAVAPSPPHPDSFDVSPGWEVMELIRPMRG